MRHANLRENSVCAISRASTTRAGTTVWVYLEDIKKVHVFFMSMSKLLLLWTFAIVHKEILPFVIVLS
jgi:hypothetical protein